METSTTSAMAEPIVEEEPASSRVLAAPAKPAKPMRRSWRPRRRAPSRIVGALRTVPLFSTCSPRELDRITRLGTSVTVGAGTEITTQGRPGSEFLLVIQGYARCSVDGREVSTLGPGDFFGEVSLLNGGPRSATVTAKTEMQLLDLDRREFYGMLDSVPTVTRKLLSVVASYHLPPSAIAP